MVMRVVDDTGTLSSLSFSLKRSIVPSERRSGGDQSTKGGAGEEIIGDFM